MKEPEEEVDGNDLYVGLNASAIGIGRWQWSGARSVLSAGVMGGVNRFRNETIGGTDLDNGREQQLSARFDARHQLTAAIELEAGGEVDVLRESRWRQRPVTSTTYRVVNDYSGDGTRLGAYGSARWAVDALAQHAAWRARGSLEPDRRHDGVALAAGGVARLVEHVGSRRDRRLPAVPQRSSR